MMLQARGALGVDLPVTAVLSAQSIAALAGHFERPGGSKAIAAPAFGRDRAKRPTTESTVDFFRWVACEAAVWRAGARRCSAFTAWAGTSRRSGRWRGLSARSARFTECRRVDSRTGQQPHRSIEDMAVAYLSEIEDRAPKRTVRAGGLVDGRLDRARDGATHDFTRRRAATRGNDRYAVFDRRRSSPCHGRPACA